MSDENDGDRQEPTPLKSLASGGLSGLMQGLRAMGETPEDIDDPEALRRAEEMVARATGEPAVSQAPIDEAWETVAMQTGPSGEIALQDIARALESEDVAIGWDPFEPNEAIGFTPPQLSRRPFMLQVPISQVARARQVLAGAPPEGVKYGWDAAAPPPPATGKVASSDEEFGFKSDETAARPRVGDPRLSDNMRMEQLAGGRGSGIGAAIAVAFVIVAVVVALGWFLGR
jgi:hypothetical protein